jgi:hypothetical protein
MKNSHMLNLGKLIIITGLIVSFCSGVVAQSSVDCSKLLKRGLSAEKPQQILFNLKRKYCFGLDSIDLKFFGNGPVIGSILVKLASKKNREITYYDLLTDINKSKRDTGYLSIRKLMIAQNKLESTKASSKTWESSKGNLVLVGISVNKVDDLYHFMLSNQDKNWNYRQLVVAFEQKEKQLKKN